MPRARNGLTLVEIIVATLVFSSGALALAASTAAITRQMTGSMMRSRAAFIARSRDETAHSHACSGTVSGDERILGIRSVWAMTVGDAGMLTQDIERQGPLGMDRDRFLSAVPCD